MARILIIEDDTVLRYALRVALEDEGYEVVEAPNGEIGIDLFGEQHPAVVLTDVIMPGKDGIEVIRDLKKIDPQVKLVVMSAGGHYSGQQEILEAAQIFGALRTLTKPFAFEEMLRAVAAVLSPGEKA